MDGSTRACRGRSTAWSPCTARSKARCRSRRCVRSSSRRRAAGRLDWLTESATLLLVIDLFYRPVSRRRRASAHRRPEPARDSQATAGARGGCPAARGRHRFPAADLRAARIQGPGRGQHGAGRRACAAAGDADPEGPLRMVAAAATGCGRQPALPRKRSGRSRCLPYSAIGTIPSPWYALRPRPAVRRRSRASRWVTLCTASPYRASSPCKLVLTGERGEQELQLFKPSAAAAVGSGPRPSVGATCRRAHRPAGGAGTDAGAWPATLPQGDTKSRGKPGVEARRARPVAGEHAGTGGRERARDNQSAGDPQGPQGQAAVEGAPEPVELQQPCRTMA